MKKIDLGQTINTLANIGVIAGIIFLAVEVGQFRSEMTAQSSFNNYSTLNEGLRSVSTSSYLAGAFAKLIDGDPLTTAETLSTNNYFSTIFLTWEYQWEEMEAGRFDASQLRMRANAADFRELSDTFGTVFQEQWERAKANRNPRFSDFMELNIGDR